MIVFGLFFAASFITKMLLHFYVASRNNNPVSLTGVGGSAELFWFYTKPVDEEYKKKKRICNYLHAYNLIYFSIGTIIAILNSLRKL